MTDIPRARVTDPLTSHQAAESVTYLRENQLCIYRIIHEHSLRWEKGGLTDEQILERYQNEYGYISPSGCRTRRKELCDVGLVVDSGVRDVTMSGRQTIEWRTR